MKILTSILVPSFNFCIFPQRLGVQVSTSTIFQKSPYSNRSVVRIWYLVDSLAFLHRASTCHRKYFELQYLFIYLCSSEIVDSSAILPTDIFNWALAKLQVIYYCNVHIMTVISTIFYHSHVFKVCVHIWWKLTVAVQSSAIALLVLVT